jgi:putative endonuclease
MPQTERQKIGEIGEETACLFLMKHGFKIISRNYCKKWGEIDIIAQKRQKLHFIEVKTVSCENLNNISRETSGYRPEENVHAGKLKRLSRTIQTYLLEKNVSDETLWQFDVAAVFLDLEHRQAKIRFIENIVL